MIAGGDIRAENLPVTASLRRHYPVQVMRVSIRRPAAAGYNLSICSPSDFLILFYLDISLSGRLVKYLLECKLSPVFRFAVGANIHPERSRLCLSLSVLSIKVQKFFGNFKGNLLLLPRF